MTITVGLQTCSRHQKTLTRTPKTPNLETSLEILTSIWQCRNPGQQPLWDLNQAVYSKAYTLERRKRLVPRWNDDRVLTIQNRKKAHNNLKLSPATANSVESRQLCAKTKYTIKKARIDSWRAYILVITLDTSTTSICRNINTLDNKRKRFVPSTLTFQLHG